MLKKGDKIGLVGCSDGQSPQLYQQNEQLVQVLTDMGLVPVCSPLLYLQEDGFNGSDQNKARALMDFYQDDQVKAIFDITGGDLANGLLEYLDYDQIRAHKKPFFGYSDLTVLLNTIYWKSHSPTYLYQIKNLVYRQGQLQRQQFYDSLLGGGDGLFTFPYRFYQGSQMEGVVAGGNFRCLLKLAGTPYMPDLTDKVLFLEAMSCTGPRWVTALNQMKQMGIFDEIKGILLGSFTQLEQQFDEEEPVKLLLRVLHRPLPVAKTECLGHGSDSKALCLGEHMVFSRSGQGE